MAKFIFGTLVSLLILGACATSTQIQPNQPGATASPTTGASGITGAVAIGIDISKLSSLTPTVSKVSGNVEAMALSNNLARRSDTQVNVSSEYSSEWNKTRLTDGDLKTSWFTELGDAANLGKSPYVELIFARSTAVKGINIRGNREYQDGYDVLEGRLVISDTTGNKGTIALILPQPDRDFNVTFGGEIRHVKSLRFEFTKDESTEPGLAEIEVDGRLE